MGDIKPPDYLVRVKEDYLHGGSDFFRSFTPEEMLEIMDEHGVEKAIISTGGDDSNPAPVRLRRSIPRTVRAVGQRQSARIHERDTPARVDDAQLPVRTGAGVPFGIQVAPSDASYYPLYAKCIELDLALSINTGPTGATRARRLPRPDASRSGVLSVPRAQALHGPRRRPVVGCRDPADDQVQEPALDDVAYSPKRLPAELLHFMNTRARTRSSGHRPPCADDATHHHRSMGARPARRRTRQVPLR
jgi:hypothetical protein